MKLPTLFVRFLMFFAFLLAVASPWAQAPTAPDRRVDAIFLIREHNTGAELVQVTLIEPNYPKELLTQQLNKLGELLGSAPRGLQIYTQDLSTGKKVTMLRANFAIDNLLTAQAVRLEPILKAFAGAPAPFVVEDFQILLEGVKPSPAMVEKFREDGVVVAEGVFSAQPPGVEYRIRLETQDPEKIRFPDRYEAPARTNSKPAPVSQPDQRPLLIGLFLVAGLGLGALVYLLLLRTGSRPR